MNIMVEHHAPDDLRPYARNARTHSQKQITQIAASIDAFGFNNPVLIDQDHTIIAGHGRVAAAKKLGLVTVPCVRLDHLSEAQKRAYILADNRLAEQAGWDQDILAIELQHLTEIDVDFDVTLTGFEMGEVDVILGASDQPAAKDDPADHMPAVALGPAITRSGDIWQIGRHRLICGDATVPKAYAKLLHGAKAQMVFTDPPYNLKIDGHVSGLGSLRHREFAVASGELDAAAFTRFLAGIFDHLVWHAEDGAIHFVCMDWRHQREILTAAEGAFTELKNLCVWAKTNGGMGSLYRSQHELVFVFKSGTAPHLSLIHI